MIVSAMEHDIAGRLAEVRQCIERAASDAARDPSEITLVAVGKTFPAEVLSAAVAAGAGHLGENRVQEAESKKADVKPATWHLIGPLQRNKARRALELFDVIHTLDRGELAHRLQRLLETHWPERRLPVLVEVNIAHESQKAGVLPGDAGELLSIAGDCPHLRVVGLMAIPPFEPDPEASRRHFRALRELRDTLEDRLSAPLPELSMGMSHDFEIAIAEGATMVRVGTAIFGARG
jgi:pyridoxal phosphate enzyme (YggS family)